MVLLAFCWLALGQAPAGAKDSVELRIPFEQFTVPDGLGRTITAYLSRPPRGGGDKKLPVILVVPGSGCQSVWTKHEKGLNSSLQGLVYQWANGRARVLVVEKPGVKLLDLPKQPGTATEGSREFLSCLCPRRVVAEVARLPLRRRRKSGDFRYDHGRRTWESDI